MALSRFSNTTSHQNKHLKKLERRPRMLKDFLQEDTNSSQVVTRNINVTDHTQNPNTGKLLRSRSTRATVSALHAIINALKNNIPFAAATKKTNKMEHNCTVTVKDIMRWKSFRDLAEENSPASDFGCTTTSGSWCSNGSSWCDSDFTSHDHQYLPEDEKYLPYCVGVGRDCMKTRKAQEYNAVGPEHGDGVCEEKEQCSPLSVLQVDSQFSEDAHPFSSSYLSLANDLLEFEEEEEANELGEVRALMLLHTRLNQTRNIEEFDQYENYEMAKCRISSGEKNKVLDDKKEECVREMEKGEKWSNFHDEQQHICFQIQEDLLDSMLDELLIHPFF